MTEQEKEIQELRRKIAELESEIRKLNHIRQLDMAEIKYQRRVIDMLMEGNNG